MASQDVLKYSHTIGFLTNTDGRGFNNPVDVGLGRDEMLYVVNRASSDAAEYIISKKITVCNINEDYLGQFSDGGMGDGEIMWPVSIALDKDENLYVSDEALDRISIFSNAGNFLGKWGVKGSGEGEFDRPAGIVFDTDDNLLVVDCLNHRVQKYTKDGRFLSQWGGHGSGDGEFNMPWGIALDSEGNVFVADWRNDRIQKLDASGNHLASWGISGDGDGQFRRPSGVAVDSEGTIYVTDWGNERVQVLDSQGNFLAKLRGDASLSKWARDYFTTNGDEFEERQGADMEPELDPAPNNFLSYESGSIEKLFWGPMSIKVDAKGRVFVVDTCRHRIQIYQKA